jgi:hypothetical protein
VKKIILACAVTVFIVGAPEVYARQIGPAANLCAEMNRLNPGDELVLLPGRYRGPCSIRKGGVSGRPVVIRSSDLERPAVLVYTGRTANVLDIKADHVVIRGLVLEAHQREADGIRIYARDGVLIEDCQFLKLGGIAIVANHFSASKIIVRRNTIKQSGSTAMYFGCHDGKACAISDLVIENNYIHGVMAPDPEIGYGIQVKLNSSAVIRDNVIVNTKGPGIMVYGSQNRDLPSLIERNFVQGSTNAAGIVIGGGPAKVYNNISIANSEGGIQLQDYGKRGLLRDIIVSHNTMYDNERGGLVVSTTDRVEAEIVFNAIASIPGKVALPGAREGLRMRDNRDCSDVPCFVDAKDRNFTPLMKSPLLAVQQSEENRDIPKDDFFGRSRGLNRAVGAVEPPGAAVVLGLKVRN